MNDRKGIRAIREEPILKMNKKASVDYMIQSFKMRQCGKDRKILLIEHNIINQMIVYDMLEILDITSITAVSSCKEGLELLEINQYDIIFIDLSTPLSTELIKELKKNRKICKYPIVIMTSNRSYNILNDCMEIGINDVLTIPVGFKPFIDVLGKYFCHNCSVLKGVNKKGS